MRFIDCAVFCFGRGGFFAFRALGRYQRLFLPSKICASFAAATLPQTGLEKCERTRDGALKNGTALVPAGA
jgi:hypothetical protein